MSIEKFAFPTTIHFGAGARKLVAEHLARQGVKRPLVVTDRGIAALPLLAQFVGELKGLDVGVYSGIHGNPVRKQVMDGAQAYKAHRADAVFGREEGAVEVGAEHSAPLRQRSVGERAPRGDGAPTQKSGGTGQQ